MAAVQYLFSKRRSAPPDCTPEAVAQIDFYRNVWFSGQALPWLILGVGNLSGNLNVWSVFRLGDGNPFELAFIGVILALVWGGAGWCICAGGAKKIVDLRLIEQFGGKAGNYTERGVKIIAGMAMFAP
ncbi:MAG: hypothetical protein ABIT83_15215, partial [Massilia sp.]